MATADIASSQHQVLHISGIEAAIRYRINIVETEKFICFLASAAKALDHMDIHWPAAVCNCIFKAGGILAILLFQHIVAQNTPTFPLSGQEADPFQLVIIRAVLSAVFDMVPHAEHRFQQLIPDRLAVLDHALLPASKLDPPISGADLLMRAVLHILFCIGIRPKRTDERNRMSHIPRLQHQGTSHCIVVGMLRRVRLVINVFPFAPNYRIRTRQCGKHCVSGCVHKHLCVKAETCFRILLNAANSRDPLTVHYDFRNVRIQIQRQIFLKRCLFP